eukprot:4454404-Pyramimonas_sp.AAC.1
MRADTISPPERERTPGSSPQGETFPRPCDSVPGSFQHTFNVRGDAEMGTGGKPSTRLPPGTL